MPGPQTLVTAGMSSSLDFVPGSLGAERWDRMLWTRQERLWASSSEGVGCDGVLGLALRGPVGHQAHHMSCRLWVMWTRSG